ncbi:hypothetical protein RINTHH_800 [Richelia intracellularis HH01]|mgnify:CR=1 FL=1|uniref:AMIN domain-containing protein n=1 Tax=Richelia intracellularis HH01 TaxID=1165094 RepID=M1X255_9NOST|nr:AMIN domain-containing protein [Richelia intracellularis]CCH66235.1 hypothetical protein RINTHH_800 [Richelia intracellularis HH01]
MGCVPNKQEFSGAIKSIRLSQFNADVTRVVLDIKPGNILNANQLQLQSFTWKGENIWVLHPSKSLDYNKGSADFYAQVGNNKIIKMKELQIPTSYLYSNDNSIYPNNQSIL